MLELRKLSVLPKDTLEGGLELLQKVGLLVTISEKEGSYYVHCGDSCLLKADNKDCADSFVYGLAYAFSTTPLTILKQLKEYSDAIAKGQSVVVREFDRLGPGSRLG